MLLTFLESQCTTQTRTITVAANFQFRQRIIIFTAALAKFYFALPAAPPLLFRKLFQKPSQTLSTFSSAVKANKKKQQQ